MSQRGDGRLRPWVASADDAAIGYVVTEGSGAELWTVAPDGQGAARRVADITEFVWYGDSRRVLVTRLRGSEKELVAVHLETGEERVLYTGALRELHRGSGDRAVVAQIWLRASS